MAADEIKVFYSWQSDLPANQTRSLIQGGIDAAVRALKNTVEVIADRDTKDVLGTPDITETIFNKISDADIFIADISIINRYSASDDAENASVIKYSPNPNVLVELGFAAATLGWDHVICVLNTDYGGIEDLPFDLAHRRPLGYSLNKSDKATIRKNICSVVMSAVSDVLENGVRAKKGFSNILLGSYDFEHGIICNHTLLSLPVDSLPGYMTARREIIEKGKPLIQAILDYPVYSGNDNVQENPITSSFATTSYQKIMDKISQPVPVVISKEEKEEAKYRIKELYDIDVPESFFDFGQLQKKVSLVPPKTEYIGTDDDKSKYDKYEDLRFIMSRISLLELFVKSFDTMKILPLCVVNKSTQTDEDITVTVRIEKGVSIQPSRELFNEQYRSTDENKGLEGYVYEEGMIKDVFLLPEDQVQYDTDISYDIQDSLRESQRDMQRYFSGTSSDATVDDYEYEIKKFIACAEERIKEPEYIFEISKLRPQEKKWLGPVIMVKPAESGQVSIKYSIKSTHSLTILEGTLSST